MYCGWFCRNLLPIFRSEHSLKVEATGSSKTLISVLQTTWHHIKEGCDINMYCYQKLESNMHHSFTPKRQITNIQTWDFVSTRTKSIAACLHLITESVEIRTGFLSYGSLKYMNFISGKTTFKIKCCKFFCKFYIAIQGILIINTNSTHSLKQCCSWKSDYLLNK